MHPLVFLCAAVLCIVHCRSQCVVQNSGVNATSQRIIIKKHNELRANVANGNQSGLPQAANMYEMVYDDALAVTAQNWANKCVFAHDNASDRDTGRGYTGQNIAFESSQNTDPDWDLIIKVYYDEIMQFNGNTVANYTFQEATSHFTQLIWGNSSRIGCGFVSFKQGNMNSHLYGCNFLPGGNIVGDPVYLVGKPCSKCGGCGRIQGLCPNKTSSLAAVNVNFNLTTGGPILNL